MRRILLPLALTQFVASFAGSSMNVSITSISKDLDTTVHGVQTAITLFLLCMAALMIPGSKLTDILGRKRCLIGGLTVYGTGAVVAALAPVLGVLIVGYSALEGIGSALMIPPIYILATIFFDDMTSRARAFGVISGMAGIGAAAGPLLGGLITTAISWRVTFLLQAAIVGLVVLLSRAITDPLPADRTRKFDIVGGLLSAAGMFFVVMAILQIGVNGVLVAVFAVLGAGLLFWFFLHIRSCERKGTEPLLSRSLFRNRTSNLALATQNIQWLLLMGTAFVVSVYLQVLRGYSAIDTGLIFTAATAGILVSSLAAERLAKRHAQSTLIRAGFLLALVGIALLLALVRSTSGVATFIPGLLLIGLGVGTMLTPSVNVVQSSFPEERQGEISGLSRSVSNLGSSLGTAIGGTILIAAAWRGNHSYALAMIALGIFGVIGLAVSMFLPSNPPPRGQQ
ncbi:MAG TPA: MFS transporter [Solirubrobacteraceae bacterium]|nr:MFS transporter [Solirubrobacteraceae bacterium]